MTMIYADNAATSKLDSEAFEAMKPYLLEEYANASQPYSFARSAKKALKKAREEIAACIGALPEEIFFTSGGTESDNWAVKGMMKYGDHRAVVTSVIEHHAVLNTCAAVERFGFPVVYVPVDEKGIIYPEKLEEYMPDQTKLVSIMFANNEIGTIEPIQELCKVAHEHGALFHTDAVQAVGHVRINVRELGVDMLSASAHKFNGPRGIGFLYIKNGTQIHPLHDGGAQESNLRAGTENIAAIVGMAAALKKNCAEMEQNAKHLENLEQCFLKRLNQGGVNYIHNGSKNHLPGNISISIKGADGEMLLHRMDLKKICISTGSACDSVNNQISHVIQAIEVPEEYARGTIRISLGKENTEQEIIKIADALINIIISSK